MVDRVTELDNLTTFGFFLQGNADIDNNQYRGDGSFFVGDKAALSDSAWFCII